MDWKQIEKDFEKWALLQKEITKSDIVNWFKNLIESELPPPPLTEEEKSEFYTTNITSEIKAKYVK